MAYNDSMGSRRLRAVPIRQKRGAAAGPSPEKAREMLHNPPGGRPLTRKQRGLFGALASGQRRRRGM